MWTNSNNCEDKFAKSFQVVLERICYNQQQANKFFKKIQIVDRYIEHLKVCLKNPLLRAGLMRT